VIVRRKRHDRKQPYHIRRDVNSELLIVAGTGFLTAYAGTLYLARALQAAGHSVRLMVTATEEEAAEYAKLDVPVNCLIRKHGPGFLRKWETLRHRLAVILAILCSRRVILTESYFLSEAALAKRLRGDTLKLGHYCQELHLADEYPYIPRLKLLNCLARVPDFVVDVEPNRARTRMTRQELREMPYVLRNTLPASAMPPRAAPGGLERLAGVALPQDYPILIHMGGIGREKPLERVIDAVSACDSRVFFLAFCNGSSESIEILRQYAERKLAHGTFAILGPRRRADLLACAWEADIGVVDYSPSVENTSNQRYCAPTKLYEFMALGLAILGSDNDSLREVIEAERIGKCAASGDVTALGSALEEMIADNNELRAMGSRAAQTFQERHCYEKLCIPVVNEISKRLVEARCGNRFRLM
jgi:glycosyltransferase involved in cell wall biosynthesis